VSFVLTTEAGEGESRTFEREARFGRTADNDIVVKDAAASRSHAKVYERRGRFFVEDSGSANGTRVNGAAITAPRELKGGEVIAIGDAEYLFSQDLPEAAEPEEEEAPPNATLEDEEEAEPLPDGTQADPSPPPARRAALARRPAPARAAPADDDEEPPDASAELESSIEEGDEEDLTGDADAGRALARGRPVAVRSARGKIEAPVSVADKARNRREMQKTAQGRVALAFQELPGWGKALVVVLVAAAVLGSVGGVAYWATRPKVNPQPEPLALVPNAPTEALSYGLGFDVDYPRPDQKSFIFEVSSALRSVAVVHFMSTGISKGEVTVSVNGHGLGEVPPDVEDKSREHQIVVPVDDIKLKEKNVLVFDNEKNPPASEEWKVWNIWLELIPVPDMAPEAAAIEARKLLSNAQEACDRKNIGSRNLFECWRLFREAWLLLQASASPPEELLETAVTKMKEVRPELDRKCNSLVIEYQHQSSKNLHTKARAAIKDVFNYFPTRQHPCHQWAQQELLNYEGFELPAIDQEE
jgi:pSer/pThr/pTyr-binding forkhead associated (FHA) protein